MAELIWAGYALPDASAAPRSDFAVYVEGNRIVATGSLSDLKARYPAAHLVGGANLILLPAMVNSHDHGRGLGTVPLGVPDDLLEVWLLGLRVQPPLDPYLAAAYDGLRLLRSGVALTAHSHNPRDQSRIEQESEATLRGYRDAGIRVAYHPPIVNQNSLVYVDEGVFIETLPADLQPLARSFRRQTIPSPDEYFGLCHDLFRRYHDSGTATIQIQVSPVAAQWCSDDVILGCVQFARNHGTRVQMHMLETRYQRAYALRTWGKSTVRHLEEIGALGSSLTLPHMVWVDLDDLDLLAERDVGIAHNPSSNLRLRSGIASVPEFLAAGISLGIGLDGHTLDDDQDYLRELRLAWTLANRPGAESATVPASAIWSLGTTGGAAITLGKEIRLGKLEAGYLADLVLIDRGSGLDDWTIGLSAQASPDATLAYLPELMLRSASHQNVRDVMVNGEWVLRDRHSTKLDETTLVSELRQNLAVAAKSGGAAANPTRTIAPYVRQYYAGWDRDSDEPSEPRKPTGDSKW